MCGGRGAFLSSLHQRAAGPGRDTALPPPPLPSPPFLPSLPLLSSPPPGPQAWALPSSARGLDLVPGAGGRGRATPPGSVEPHPASTRGAPPTTRQAHAVRLLLLVLFAAQLPGTGALTVGGLSLSGLLQGPLLPANGALAPADVLSRLELGLTRNQESTAHPPAPLGCPRDIYEHVHGPTSVPCTFTDYLFSSQPNRELRW